tara:strand:+ start:7060 stop:7950 length:891 start_codon:yes stop_codon:yes gene_type:complete
MLDEHLLRKITGHEVLLKKPPVLLDIGASGDTFPLWKQLIPFSHCIAFEPDERERDVLESTKNNWKKYTSFRSVATSESIENLDFHLTEFPFCSSTLKPDNKSLADWDFADLFEVQKTVAIEASNIDRTLSEAGISHIDWFKTDSQGTDLRLFATLSEKLRRNIVVADFEPGIIDAYVGEDKLHHVMAFMDNEPFWVNSMEIKGSKRILSYDLNKSEIDHKQLITNQKTSPCWCEISYLNDMKSSAINLRTLLLGWVFSTLLEQHGFALRICRKGDEFFKDKIFKELSNYSISLLS